ncbi:MAG: RES family NAD+ phosphorylase [Acidimicrobiales bacterium]
MSSPIGSDFPSIAIHPERVLYRVHRTVNDPLYFASSGNGRFDLTDQPGTGTCYLSPSPTGAYLETLGRLRTLSEDDIEERSLSEIVPTTSLSLADLTDRQVLGRYQITGDISTGTNYGPSQALADQLYRAGLDGIYYTARHDPAFQERSVAVFGTSTASKLFAISVGPIPTALVNEVAHNFGLIVLP